jgi:PAS domain S-box-containing protein
VSERPHPPPAPLGEVRSQIEGIFDNAAVGLTQIGLDGRFQIANDALCRFLGRPRELLLTLGVTDVTHPDDLARSFEAVGRAAATGDTVSLDKRYLRPDGSLVWAHSSMTPMRSAAGTIEGILAVVTDLTARRDTEEALRQSEQRLRLALQAGHLGTWDWNIATGEVVWSDEHFRMQGLPVNSVTPSYEEWVSHLHPDDRQRVEAQLVASRDGRAPFEAEFRLVQPDGAISWGVATGLFFYDEAGAACRMIGVQRDVTERRQWLDRQQVLIAELQHRTRNLLGVVRSLADKTVSDAGSLDAFGSLFRERIDALARVNALLSRLDEGQRVAFDDLLRTELSARGVLDGERAGKVVLDGPPGVRLRSATVQTFALALHELATNAVKYGALAAAEGRLVVRWHVARDAAGEARLRVEWRESGVPDMPADDEAPRGGGFGRELIEKALPYQLRADTSYELTADGVRCTVDLPFAG